jgi:uncharacterized protein
MNALTQRVTIAGPAGAIECAIDRPAEPPAGLAVLCHPHPLHGGTMDNKVVQTLARACVQLGWRTVRFNFRGIGQSEGQWDNGNGEIDDAWAVIQAHQADSEPLLLGGFSFGAYVASQVAARRAADDQARPLSRLVLVGPAVVNFAVAPARPATLVVHGETDDVVPLKAVFDWARPQALPVTVLPGAGHFFHGQLPVLKQIVLQALGLRPPVQTP